MSILNIIFAGRNDKNVYMHKHRRLKSWSIALESGTGIWYIIIRKGDTDVQVRKALSAKGSRVGAADRNTLADSKHRAYLASEIPEWNL